jgi:hypothetical protein
VFGTAGLIAAFLLLPHDQPISDEPIDGLGSGLLGLMMLALIYGLIQGSTNGWTAAPIASLAAGAVLLGPSHCASGTPPARSSSRRCC